MRRVLLTILPAAGLAFATAPALAQPDRYWADGAIPSGGGVHTNGTTWTPAPSAADMTPVQGVLGAPVALLTAPFTALSGGPASPAAQPHCWVIRDWWGTRYTSVCGP